jgi:hypothetical protein
VGTASFPPQPILLSRSQPVIDFLADLITGVSTYRSWIFTFQLFSSSVHRSQVVISEFAPLLLNLSLELFPVTFDPVRRFIAPDFATRQSVSFLAKWRSLRRERAKLKELRLFALISRIHTHRRNRYIFVTMSSQIVAAIAIVARVSLLYSSFYW